MKYMKNTIIIVILLILVGFGAYFYSSNNNKTVLNTTDVSTSTSTDTQNTDTNTQNQNSAETVIGNSVEGNNITAYHFGTGDKNLLFVGGIHGGYEWNTVLVAYQLMDYLEQNPDIIPQNIKVTVIPVLNPDGLSKTVGKTGRFSESDVPSSTQKLVDGRFNANSVDLNRNFECDWQENAVWQNKKVSGGSSAFSEPESQAMKTYVENLKPAGVVVWYSAAGGVYASNCHNGVSAETSNLTKLFAKASGYPAYNEFNFYEITGDMVNWLAKQNIPAISVLLTNHKDTEWNKNLEGIKAMFDYYAK